MDSRQVTSLIPTSPVPRHPNTELMDETVAGIRHHLPDSPIIIMADGVWSGVSHRKEQYEEYQKNIEGKYPNTRIVRFQTHTQQVNMTRYCIQNFIQTPYIWFNEHDAPLRTDRAINWDAMLEAVSSGRFNIVRLSYFEEGIHEAHQHLVTGIDWIQGEKFVRTTQFSGWPHLSTVKFYVNKILPLCNEGDTQMVEIAAYGPCANAPWDQWRVGVYCPSSPAQRFYHRNGRENDKCSWG
jgi:hypothetical protein